VLYVQLLCICVQLLAPFEENVYTYKHLHKRVVATEILRSQVENLLPKDILCP
jgi:hypothetical protein